MNVRHLALVGILGVMTTTGVYSCSNEPSGRSRGALATMTSVQLWRDQKGVPDTIPFCFYLDWNTNHIDGGDGSTGIKDPRAREAFRCAVERSWPAVSGVSFTGWTICPTSGNDRVLPYAINTKPGTTVPDGTVWGNIGRVVDGNYVLPSVLSTPASAGPHLGFVNAGSPPGYNTQFMEIVVHEVGHTLGFIHEHDSTHNRYPDGGPRLGPDGGPEWSRDVPQTLAGLAPEAVSVAISGAVPFNPLAMVWNLGSLFVVDRLALGSQSALRLVRIDPVTAIATELWRTQGTASWPVSGAHLTSSRFGELVLSLNLTSGAADLVSFRADDGQPIQSTSVARVASPTVSDGSGFTAYTEQEQSDTTASARLTHFERDQLLGGVCGTSWLRFAIGNQSGAALGNPAVECQ